jgi:hypothetical protein
MSTPADEDRHWLAHRRPEQMIFTDDGALRFTNPETAVLRGSKEQGRT